MDLYNQTSVFSNEGLFAISANITNASSTSAATKITHASNITSVSPSAASSSSSSSSSSMAADLEILIEINHYASPVVILFGIVTNILTLLTLRDRELKKAPYSYLTALAAADLSALLIAGSFYGVEFFEESIRKQSYHYCWYICYFYYPLINLASTTGIFITVTMAIERCLFIKFPFWVLAHKSRARIKIGCVFLVSVVITFPRFLWYTPAPDTNQPNATDAYVISEYKHGSEFALVVTWIHSVVINCLPVVLLIFLNAFLIYKFRFEHRRRSELGISSTMSTVWGREQTRLTYTYSIVTGAFTVLIMPSAFTDKNLSNAIFGVDGSNHSIKVLQLVSNFLVLVNLSLNFLMYTFINIKFTRAFKLMLFRWRMRARSVLFCCTLESRRRARLRHEQFKMTMTSEEKVLFNNNKNSNSNQHHHHHHHKNHIRQQYMCRSTLSRNGTSVTTLSSFRMEIN